MEGLTQEQEQEVNRDKKVQAYLGNNQSVVDTFLPLKNKQTTLNGHLTDLTNLIPGKLPTTKGITTGKAAKKKAVGVYYESVCGVCRAYLIEKNNTALAINFNITERKIIGLPDNDVLGLITELNHFITNDMLPNADFADYGITALTLTDGLTLATDFNNAIGQAPSRDAEKTATGKAIADMIDLIKADVDSIDLLVRNFITSNKDFYNGFQAANKIDDIGVHHSGIRGEVEATGGAVVKNAVIACAALNKSTQSDLLGHYELIKMKPGTYEFTCSHPDFATQTKVITIKKGRIIEVDWKL